MTTPDTAVLACERCLTRPAACYDTYADRVVCRTCQPAEPPSAYDCEFVTSIPADLPVTFPPRPVLPGGPDEPTAAWIRGNPATVLRLVRGEVTG